MVNMNNKNICVLGADGYIGANLVNYLKTKDVSLWSYDSKRGTHGEDFDANGISGYKAIVLLAAFPGIINCRVNITEIFP